MGDRSRATVAACVALGATSCGLVVSFDEFNQRPSSQAYFAGGNVSGLSPNALVELTLSRRFGDISAVLATMKTGNGQFTFSSVDARLPDGSEITVAVVRMPETHVCEVTRGERTIEGADLADVAVGCSVERGELQDLSIRLCDRGDVDAGTACTGEWANLTPPFSPALVAYDSRADVNRRRTDIAMDVTVLPRHPLSRVVFDGTVQVGTARVVLSTIRPPLELVVDVTAPDTVTQKRYSVTFTVPGSP